MKRYQRQESELFYDINIRSRICKNPVEINVTLRSKFGGRKVHIGNPSLQGLFLQFFRGNGLLRSSQKQLPTEFIILSDLELFSDK